MGKKYKRNGALDKHTFNLNTKMNKLKKLKQEYHNLYNWQKGILAPKIKKLKKDINKIEKSLFEYQDDYIGIKEALEILEEI